MKKDLPSALQVLLETPLEEELFSDWVELLESLVPTFAPPSRHLGLCMTLLVHPIALDDIQLQSACHRILVRTLELHGARAFKDVLQFQPQDIARLKRKKLRLSVEDTINGSTTEDATSLVGTEGLFVQFSSLWECLSCALSQEAGGTDNWLQLASFIHQILQQDWNTCVNMQNDFAKTIVVQQIKSKSDKSVDIGKVLRLLFTQHKEHEVFVHNPYDSRSSSLTGGAPLEPDARQLRITILAQFVDLVRSQCLCCKKLTCSYSRLPLRHT